MVGVDQFRDQPSGEGLRGDGVQGIAANLIEQVTGLFHNSGTLSGTPVTGGADKGAEVLKAGGVQKGIGLGGVHPVKGTVTKTCLVLDADRSSTRHSVCLVTGAAQVGDGLSEHLMGVQQSDGVVLISDARVVNGTVGLEGHLGIG